MSTLALLIVLAVCAVAVIAALAYLGVRAWRLFRTVTRVSRSAGAQARLVADKAALASAKAETFAQGGEDASEVSRRLQASLRRLSVLSEAIAEARYPWSRIRGVLKK